MVDVSSKTTSPGSRFRKRCIPCELIYTDLESFVFHKRDHALCEHKCPHCGNELTAAPPNSGGDMYFDHMPECKRLPQNFAPFLKYPRKTKASNASQETSSSISSTEEPKNKHVSDLLSTKVPSPKPSKRTVSDFIHVTSPVSEHCVNTSIFTPAEIQSNSAGKSDKVSPKKKTKNDCILSVPKKVDSSFAKPGKNNVLNKMAAPKIPKFSCRTCGRKFRYEKNLRTHPCAANGNITQFPKQKRTVSDESLTVSVQCLNSSRSTAEIQYSCASKSGKGTPKKKTRNECVISVSKGADNSSVKSSKNNVLNKKTAPKVRNVWCRLCGYKFCNKKKLNTHSCADNLKSMQSCKVVTKKGLLCPPVPVSDFLCRDCGDVFWKKDYYIRHLEKCKLATRDEIICVSEIPLVNTAESGGPGRVGSDETHENSSVDSDNLPTALTNPLNKYMFQCICCGGVFTRQECFEKHVRKNHSSNTSCPKCKTRFDSPMSLGLHICNQISRSVTSPHSNVNSDNPSITSAPDQLEEVCDDDECGDKKPNPRSLPPFHQSPSEESNRITLPEPICTKVEPEETRCVDVLEKDNSQNPSQNFILGNVGFGDASTSSAFSVQHSALPPQNCRIPRAANNQRFNTHHQFALQPSRREQASSFCGNGVSGIRSVQPPNVHQQSHYVQCNYSSDTFSVSRPSGVNKFPIFQQRESMTHQDHFSQHPPSSGPNLSRLNFQSNCREASNLPVNNPAIDVNNSYNSLLCVQPGTLVLLEGIMGNTLPIGTSHQDCRVNSNMSNSSLVSESSESSNSVTSPVRSIPIRQYWSRKSSDGQSKELESSPMQDVEVIFIEKGDDSHAYAVGSETLGGESVEKYICKKCMGSFFSKHKLAVHLEQQHNLQVERKLKVKKFRPKS